MSRSRKSLGAWGEAQAASLLARKGYQIVAQNWRCARGELDLIVTDGDELVFAEVKTRRGRDMGAPEEGLTRYKAEQLVTLAQLYLAETGQDADWRIDPVAVELDASGRLQRCDHIPNAVLGW